MVQSVQAFLRKFSMTATAALMVVFLFGVGVQNADAQTTIPYERTFDNEVITDDGWSTQLLIGTLDWEVTEHEGQYRAEMSNFDGSNNESETWLITQNFNLSGTDEPVVNFTNESNFSGPDLEFKVSTDYDGTSVPSTATWTDLSSEATLSSGGWETVNSGNIDVSAYKGANTYFAFRYTGSDSDGATWNVLDFEIVEAADAETILFSESGGGSAPAGWTFGAEAADIDRTSYWLVETEDEPKTDYFIVTDSYDLSSFATAEFDVRVATFGSGGNNPAKVEISYDGGSNYTQVETTETPTSSDYIDGGPILLNDISDNVVIRISNNGTTGRGVRLQNLSLTAFGVAGQPILNTDVSSLSGFTYAENDGPSEVQSFNLTGSNLDGSNVTISAPDNFEVSESESTGFGSSVTLDSYDGSQTSIYVRLQQALSVNTFSGDLTITGGGASSEQVALSGEVIEPIFLIYEFTGNSANPTQDPPNASTSALQLSSGSVGFGTAHSGEWGGSGVPYAEGSGGWGAADMESAKYFYFSIDPDLSYGVTLSNISFDYRATGAGPDNFAVTINGEVVHTEIGFTANNVHTFNMALTDFENLSSAEVRIHGWAGGGGAFRLNDIRLDGEMVEDIYFASLSGEAGWRMLSLPVGDIAVNVLAGQNLVQGVTGADAFYDDGNNYEAAAANLFYYLDTTGDDWQEFGNFDSEISSGQGFIWYMFDNDDFNSVTLPFTLSVSGTSPSADVTTPINPSDDFTLTGNPFAGNLDASDVSGWGDLQATARTWDPGAGAEGDYVNTTASASPFTGFFVEKTVGGSGDITIPVAATSSKSPGAESFRISLNLQGVNDSEIATSDNSTSVVFREGATNDWDIYDATKLVPLLSSYATLGIVGDRAGEERIKAIDSRPIDFEGVLDLPVALNISNFGGEFELSANMENLPESWSVFLHDSETGETIDLMKSAHSFTHQTESQNVSEINNRMPEQFVMSADDAIHRFTLTIEAGESVNIGGPDELPQRVALNQNYPNPFNPSTVISYELPQASDVTIAVYDMTGRQIATLVNNRMEAGTHEVSFDASNLASGVYLYRLQAGNHVLTRKLTLIK